MSVGFTPEVTNIYNTYAVMDGNGNGQADGLKNFTINDNAVLFEEANGETFTVTVNAQELEQLKAAQQPEATEQVQNANEVSTAGKSSEEIQKEIDALNETKAVTMEEMEKIEETVEALADDVKKKIEESAEQRDKRVEDYEENIKTAVKQNVDAYVAANKAEKEGMTQDQLQANIAGAVSEFAPDLSDIVSNLFVANSEIDLIDSHLANLRDMASNVSDIESQISVKESEYAQAKAAEEAAARAAESSKSCDPIGFTNEEGAKFDFIVMDGAFDTTSDFLGSTGNWDAMTALNTNGDTAVDLGELKTGNIGLVMTGKNGEQKVMNADEIEQMFGSDFKVDLASYDQNGTHSAVSNGDHDNDGIADQTLKGTFNITAGGKTLAGYNTDDDQDWLAETYGLTANVTDAEKAEAAGEDNFQLEGSEELQEHVAFINQWTETAKQLRVQLQTEFENKGFSEELIGLIGESAKVTADNESTKFYNELEAQRAEKAEKEEQEAPVDGTEDVVAENEEEDPEKKRDEEELAA